MRVRAWRWLSLRLLSVLISLPVFAASDLGLKPDEWRLIGRDSEQHQFSPLKQINLRNVRELGLAWFADMPTKDGMVGVPLVADGLIFQSGSLGKVFANDARTGKAVWTFDAQVRFPLNIVQSWGARVSRGLALWRDSVIFATGDCRLIALDLHAGTKRWETQNCGRGDYRMNAAAPRVGNGKVFVGNGNGDITGVRGYVDAYDATTGKHLWRFYTVPGDPAKGFENAAMERASKTWGKEYWKKSSGGDVWDGITYDDVLNLVYIGTDGPEPVNPHDRAEGRGDELYTTSIVALNADTGEYVWHYQTTPGDGWNFDATMHIMIADLPINGAKRRVVMEAPKNGFFYVLDAHTGKLLSANNFVPVNWASGIDMQAGRPVVNEAAKWWLKPEGAVVVPSGAGAHSWEPMSFDPETGLVYIPAMKLSVRNKPGPGLAGVSADWYMSMNDRHAFTGELVAWDPVGQKARWRYDHGAPRNGGVLSTAGNLVFEGTTSGTFEAFRADTGEKLWSYNTHGSGVFAAPSTVAIDGTQLIYVPVGSGTTSGQLYSPLMGAGPGGPARLLAFKLGGAIQLPPELPQAPFTKPPLPRPTPELARQGQEVFERNGCDMCHGYHAIAARGGSVPDLRRATAETYAELSAIVLGGARLEKGMPTFAGKIDANQLKALQSYILEQAWTAYDAQQRGTDQVAQQIH